jgi:DNA-binding transcriptional regulator YdaS (Cro superfamily)
MDDKTPIQRAIEHAGSEAKLGEGIGFSQVAINKAKHRGSVSAEMALAIHRFTAGAVPASDLRPDLWTSPDDVPLAPDPSAPPAEATAEAAE